MSCRAYAHVHERWWLTCVILFYVELYTPDLGLEL